MLCEVEIRVRVSPDAVPPVIVKEPVPERAVPERVPPEIVAPLIVPRPDSVGDPEPVILPVKVKAPILVAASVLTVSVPVVPLSARVKSVLVPSVIDKVPVLPIEIAGDVELKEIGVAELLVKPPLRATEVVVAAPLPVTVARVSASVAVMVIVDPDADTELIPAPAIVKAPVSEFRELTPLLLPETVVQDEPL